MKKYKQVECWGNLSLLLAFVIYYSSSDYNAPTYFNRLTVLLFGGLILFVYQLVNIIIQQAYGWFKNIARIIIQYFTYSMFFMIFFSSLLIFKEVSYLPLYTCFRIIPFLFLFYTCLCFFEYYQLNNAIKHKIETKMQLSKRIDLGVQLIVFIVSTIIFFIQWIELISLFSEDSNFLLYSLLISAYIRVSFFQLVSVIVHHVAGWCQYMPRKQYQYISYLIPGVILFWINPLHINSEGIIIISKILYALPFMVIFYFCLCLYEYKQLRKTK